MNISKPVVDCVLQMDPTFLSVGGVAYLLPSNHPNHIEGHSISNKSVVRTSQIVSVDRLSNRFETQNTIYHYSLDD